MAEQAQPLGAEGFSPVGCVPCLPLPNPQCTPGPPRLSADPRVFLPHPPPCVSSPRDALGLGVFVKTLQWVHPVWTRCPPAGACPFPVSLFTA